MKRCVVALAVLFLALLGLPAAASANNPLVADLSNYRINIDSGFSGTRLFLFGARNDNGDVVVVIRGPNRHYTIRKKEQIAGVWVNTQSMKFKYVPDFYVVASSKPLEQVQAASLFKQLRIGTDTLLRQPDSPEAMPAYLMFSQAFYRHQQERRLYLDKPVEVSFMGETLFKTQIDFPDTIPKGDYTAEIYLISEGELVGVQTTPIRVAKIGLDAFLFDYAHNNPLMYGISAVVIALCAGWGVGRLFEKF